MTGLTDFSCQVDMLLGIMAFQAAFIPAQCLLMKAMVENRAGFIVIRVAFRAGACLVIWQVQVVTKLAFTFPYDFILQPFLVICMGKIHHIAGLVPVDVQCCPTRCSDHWAGWRITLDG